MHTKFNKNGILETYGLECLLVIQTYILLLHLVLLASGKNRNVVKRRIECISVLLVCISFPYSQVYCDMESADGGWTLIASIHENNIKHKCREGDKWSSESLRSDSGSHYFPCDRAHIRMKFHKRRIFHFLFRISELGKSAYIRRHQCSNQCRFQKSSVFRSAGALNTVLQQMQNTLNRHYFWYNACFHFTSSWSTCYNCWKLWKFKSVKNMSLSECFFDSTRGTLSAKSWLRFKLKMYPLKSSVEQNRIRKYFWIPNVLCVKCFFETLHRRWKIKLLHDLFQIL